MFNTMYLTGKAIQERTMQKISHSIFQHLVCLECGPCICQI